MSGLAIPATMTVVDSHTEGEPTRVVIDSLSELRLLAGNALRYRRYVKTGSSVGLFLSLHSRGGSYRQYFGWRTVCFGCAKTHDLGWLVFAAIGIGLLLVSFLVGLVAVLFPAVLD